MLIEVRQRLAQQVHGRRGRSIDPVWANRRLLLRAWDTLSDRARDRLSTVFDTDDATGKLQAAWLVKEQLRALLATGSHADAAAAKDRLGLGRPSRRSAGNQPALAHDLPVERDRSSYRHRRDNGESGSQQYSDQAHQRTGRGFTNARNYKTRILLRSAARTAA
jgi:transposase